MLKRISIVLVLVLISGCAFQDDQSNYEHVIYIWQRIWNEPLSESISNISNKSNSFIVLCGDLKYQDNSPSLTSININWQYLIQEGISITLAFRISTEAGKLLDKDNIGQTITAIYQTITKIIDTAPGIDIIGIQFDYDCPASKLGTYSEFIRLFKEKIPNKQISITALPTWLKNRQFLNLAKQTDYYVLQLHSFELPKTLKDAREIFPEKKAKAYTKKASSLRHPYFISLPTYGYEIAFDKKGKFIGLRAESTNILWGKNIQHAVEVVSPEEIIDFLKYIKASKPKNLKGICWFRLPVKTDEFNWDIKTLASVIDSDIPKKSFEIELVEKDKGLIEVYVVNSGEQNLWNDITFDIMWLGGQKPIYDVLGKYESKLFFDDKTIQLKGPAPKVGDKTLVSWLRAGESTIIKKGGVIYEKD